MDCDFLQVTTTCDDPNVLAAIATSLVEERLAACCQREGPVESTYRWGGGIETSVEYRLLIKTRQLLFAEVESEILSCHTYDTPQITAVAIVDCTDGYRQWLDDSIRKE